MEDALEKLQAILDGAWLSWQPIEEDPEKKKKLDKQLRALTVCTLHLDDPYSLLPQNKKDNVRWPGGSGV